MLRKLRPLIVAPLAAIIALAGAPGAVAEPSEMDNCDNSQVFCWPGGTNTEGFHTGDISITTILQVPLGTPLPDLGVDYKISKVSMDGAEWTDNDTLTEINSNILTVETLNDTSKHYDPAAIENDDNVVETYTYTLSNILPLGKDFPHAGVYEYKVVESSFEPLSPVAATVSQHLTPSTDVYYLTVYVQNGTDGLFIFAVVAEKVVMVDGAPVMVDGKESRDKVDAITYGSDKQSAMAFTNTYVETQSAPDPWTNPPLTISNTVTGFMGNQQLPFEYDITITPNALDTSRTQPYKAYIIEGDNYVDPASLLTVDPETLNATDAADLLAKAPYVSVSITDTTTFQLKHGQSLVFLDTPVGTSYEVTERDLSTATVGLYALSLDVTTAGVPNLGVVDNARRLADSTPQLVGNGSNIAAFTNNRDLITPTGLTMGSLPFVGLVAVALIALVVVVAVKYSGRKVAGANS